MKTAPVNMNPISIASLILCPSIPSAAKERIFALLSVCIMTNFYIPPQGLYFRLLGYANSHVLVSRTTNPQVYRHPQNEVFDDQFFQLIHGTGKHDGYYAIQGKVTKKVLFSKQAEPHLGHIAGNGAYEDNWFKIELGTGNHASNFRLHCDYSNTVIFSRAKPDPQVGSHRASEVFDDQYFSFLFEDVTIDRIDYHIDQGKIISSTPTVIASQTLHNDSDTQQSMEFSVNETETHTSTFEYTLGFTITVGVSGKAGIPFVAEGEVKVDVSNSHTFNWGETNSFSKAYSAKLPVVAPPRSTMRAVSSVTRSNLHIPFTTYLKSKSTGVEVQTQGIYTGATTWDLRHTVTVDPKNK